MIGVLDLTRELLWRRGESEIVAHPTLPKIVEAVLDARREVAAEAQVELDSAAYARGWEDGKQAAELAFGQGLDDVLQRVHDLRRAA